MNGWRRAKADYSNLKKETEEKQKNFLEMANAALLMEVLPIYDNIKKALNSLPADQNNAWTEGVRQIKKQLEAFLKDYGIEEIKTVGEKFNPEFHEAIEAVEGKDSGIIVEEIQKGYKLHGKVIRASKVKIYK